MSEFIVDFLNFCRAKTPSLGSVSNLETHLENVITSEIVTLKHDVLSRAEKAVENIYGFAHNRDWQNELRGRLEPDLLEVINVAAAPSSVLMSYDFHYDPTSDRLALIEINTNSSMYLPCAYLYEYHNKHFAGDRKAPIEKLRESFLADWAEYRARHPAAPTAPRLAIVDKDVEKQRMYFEFLMYRDLFESWGWNAQIIDSEMVDPSDFDFIYNRFVDFYLAEPGSEVLRKTWLAQSTFFSPHPREYLLLGDKERLVDFYQKQVDPTLLPTERIRDLIAGLSGKALDAAIENLWERRKNLFFKPRTMYGGKAAFRGNSISRRTFAEIFEGDFVAQEFLPAAEIGGKKFDLRFFAYRNEIQNACARLYTGQTTNFTSTGGGVAALEFT